MAERKLEVKIVGDSRSLERAFRKSSSASDSFGKKIGRGAGKGLLLLGTGAAVAGAAVGVGFAAALKKGVEGLGDMQKVMAQTDAALKSTKNAAKTSSKEIRTLAESIESKTGIDADAIQSGQNLLLTFTKIRNEAGKNNDIFNQASKTAVDLSVAFGTDMKSASLQLGKALNDPLKGMTALQRSGISFSQSQKDQVKSLLENGRILDAQKLILGEVNTQVKGSAEAYGKTFPGQVERAKRAFEGLTETLAGPFMGILSDTLEGLLGVFNDPAVQNGIKQFAEQVAQALGQVVAWVRANWPQIKATLQSVWDWYKTYVQSVVVPAFKAVISGIGALIGFVKLHMPEIRAAAQAAFGWIQTNIVPTVRAVASGVQTVVRGMATIWREHGNDIKAIVGPVFNTIKTLIVNALKIIKGTVEVVLALIRGDWSKAWSSFKGVVATALDSVLTVLLTTPRMMFAAAKIIGREMVEGVKAGLVAAKDALVGKFKEVLNDAMRAAKGFLNINSPSKTTMAELGFPMIEGIAYGLGKRSGVLSAQLRSVLKDAVASARGNLGGLTSTLAGMLGRINTTQIAGMTSTGSITGGKTLAEIRSEQARVQRERDKARLEEAVANAETDDERRQAEQDLNDWLIDEEARVLEEQMSQRERSYDDEIGALQDAFDRGLISAETFQAELTRIVGGNTGAELGAEFAAAFGQQLAAVISQIQELASFAGINVGPGVESPGGAVSSALRQSNEDRFQAAWDKWNEKRANRRKALTAATKKDDKGKTVKKYTPQEVDRLMADWREKNPEPKRSAYGLAKGGILRKTVFAAGEAGPEALIPLGSTRAQSMLADAVANGGGAKGSATIIHVTVNGNEFSARDFAKKLQPELNRLVGFGQV